MSDIEKPLTVVDEFFAASERRLRTTRLLASYDTLEQICDHVANGGSLTEWCRTLDIRYSSVTRWIRESEGRIKAYAQAKADRDEWADERILEAVRELGFSDITVFYGKDGKLLPINQWPAGSGRLAQSVEVDDIIGTGDEKGMKIGETQKVKLWDKSKALEQLLKNRRLLVEKTETDLTLKLDEIIGRSFNNVKNNKE